MKKRMIALILCISVGAAMAGGCGKKENTDKDSSAVTSASSSSAAADASSEPQPSDSEENGSSTGPEADTSPVVETEHVLDCVELGPYKGLELEKTITEISDQEVENYIISQYSATTITEEPCQEGDTVYIKYVGKIDGEAFEGGSSDGSAILLGQGGYIEGFEEGIIGMKAGETKDLNLTFPDPYSPNEELSGKPVVFTVTVDNISRAFPELTEDWVKTYTEYGSIEEYRAGMRRELQEQADSSAETALASSAFQKISDSSTIKQYQQSEVDAGRQSMVAQIEAMGMDEETYRQAVGLGEEEYEMQMDTYAKSIAKSNMLLKAIAEKEGLQTGDEGYKEWLKKTAEERQMSEEELISAYGQEEVDAYILQQRVMEVILENASITEVKQEAKQDNSAE